MAIKKTKILLIDWFNTLSFSKFWEPLSDSEPDTFSLIQKYLFDENWELIKMWMSGRYTSEDINKIVAKGLKMSYNKLFKEFVYSCKNMVLVSKNIPDIINTIRESGNKVYIFSDNMDSLDRWTIPSLKLSKVFDGVINSFNVRALKRDLGPDGKNLFLNKINEKDGVNLEDLILFDDNESTLSLYKSLGVKSIKIYNRHPLEKELGKFI